MHSSLHREILPSTDVRDRRQNDVASGLTWSLITIFGRVCRLEVVLLTS